MLGLVEDLGLIAKEDPLDRRLQDEALPHRKRAPKKTSQTGGQMAKSAGEQIWVWLEDPSFGPLQRIGTLSRGDRGGVRFAYDPDWLKRGHAFSGSHFYFWLCHNSR